MLWLWMAVAPVQKQLESLTYQIQSVIAVWLLTNTTQYLKQLLENVQIVVSKLKNLKAAIRHNPNVLIQCNQGQLDRHQVRLKTHRSIQWWWSASNVCVRQKCWINSAQDLQRCLPCKYSYAHNKLKTLQFEPISKQSRSLFALFLFSTISLQTSKILA